MAENQNPIFNERAAEKLRSPDDLEKYVRVTSPSVWVVIAACFCLIAGLLAWGVFGSVSTNVDTKGTVVSDKAMCFLTSEEVARVRIGDVANMNGVIMAIADVATTPSSSDEVKGLLGSDFLVSTLVEDAWTYVVTLDGDTSSLSSNVPLPVTITTEREAPISLILGDGK